MKILMKIMLLTSVYSIKENLAETTTTPNTQSNEIKKIKRGVLGLSNVQPPSGHFHYYPFAHSQHTNNPTIPQQQTNPQQGYNPNHNVKPVQDSTPDSQFNYQNPQQILPQDSPNGYIGQVEQQTATISPYFPIAPLSDQNHPQQYAPTNHYAASATNFDPAGHPQPAAQLHPQPAAQFPVHVEPSYVVASTNQQRVPAGQYQSTVQHYPAYWNGNPQFPPQQQQQPIKYPTLLNGNKPQLYQPQQTQGFPVNNPGSVAPQQFLANKNYYPHNNVRHYSQTNLATALPIKYSLSSVLPLSYTTPGPLSAHVKNHPLLLPQYKKTASIPVKNSGKDQQKAKKEETEYDEEKSDDKADHEDTEDEDEPSPRRKPKYNSYRSYSNDNDDDDYYSRYHRDDSDDDDDYSSSIRDDRDEDEEAVTAATSFKSKTKYAKKNTTGKVGNNKYSNSKNNRYNKSKPNVQKSSNYKPKSKVDTIEGKYSHQVPVTTDQKSKTHYQAKWYTYSSVNNNED